MAISHRLVKHILPRPDASGSLLAKYLHIYPRQFFCFFVVYRLFLHMPIVCEYVFMFGDHRLLREAGEPADMDIVMSFGSAALAGVKSWL